MSSNDPQTKRKILVYSPSVVLLRAFDAYVQTDEFLKNILIPSSFSENSQIYSYRTEKPMQENNFNLFFISLIILESILTLNMTLYIELV